MKRTAMLGLLAVVSFAAQAAQDPPGWRIGGQASFTQFEFTEGGIDDIDDSSVGAKVFGQYQFNNWLAVEGAYHNTGDFKETLPNSPGPNFPAGSYTIGFDGLSANAVIFFPRISDDISFALKAGFFDFDADLRVVEANSSSNDNRSYDGLTVGGAAAIHISDNFGLRADLEWFDIDFGDLYAVNIGLYYAFGGGGGSAPAAAPAPAPAPMEAAPAAEEPAAAEPAPAPAPPADSDGDGVTDDADKCPGSPAGAKVDANGCEEQIVLEGVTFETNSAQLTGASVAILDNAAALIKQRPNSNVQVSGHTDSSGPDEYNLDLSQRRATAVMDYLVSQGVDAGKLTSSGYGESQPVAGNDSAEGRAQNRRVTLDFSAAN